MGEVDISLNEALDRIRSEKVTERTDGLTDLKHILHQNRWTSKLEVITDKGYHRIFEALFRFAQNEKSAYLRATKDRAKTQSATRLSTCASVLRSAAEVAVRKIRSKTVNALVDHITQTLPEAGEGYCEPLSLDYVKCLRCILEYPPHVEHLGREEWQDLVEFCLHGIGLIDNDEDSQSSHQNGSRLYSNSMSTTSGRSTPIRISQRPNGSRSRAGIRSSAEELVICLGLLLATANAPILDKPDRLLNRVAEFLSVTPAGCNSHQAAFGALNSVLSRIVTDRMGLAQSFMFSIVPIIQRLWSTKPSLLRDEMLITLMLGRPALQNSRQPTDLDIHVSSLENLLDLLQNDYARRPERDLLQIDDIRLSLSSNQSPMGFKNLGPRLGLSRSEQNWTLVSTIANLSMILDSLHSPREPTDQPDEGRNKRRRLAKRSEEILRQASSSHGSARISALQLLPFIAAEHDSFRNDLDSALNQLVAAIVDDNGVVSSWTMLAIASLAALPAAKQAALKSQWLNVWQLASRRVSVPSTCRAGCHLMSVILHSQLLEYAAVAAVVEAMISSIDVNGPAILTDSSLSLWRTILTLRQGSNPSLARQTSTRICSWLRTSWTPEALSDRFQAAHFAAYARPLELLNLLMVCAGKSVACANVDDALVCGSISRAWFRSHRNHRLVRYLLLQDTYLMPGEEIAEPEPEAGHNASTQGNSNDQSLIELLQMKLDGYIQAWTALSAERIHHVSQDIIQIVTSVCAVVSTFAESVALPHSPRVKHLQTQNERLWSELCSYLSQQKDELVHACLEIINPFLSSAQHRKSEDDIFYRGLLNMAPYLTSILEERRRSDRKGLDMVEPDSMDIDDSFASKASETRRESSVFDSVREDLPVHSDINSFRLAFTVQMHLCCGFPRKNQETQDNSPSSIVEYLISVDAADIIASRNVIPKVLSSMISINQSDACRLLEHLGEKFLQVYELERCEASLCVCLSVMTSFVELWTDEKNDELYDTASDIYLWFIDIALGKSIASSRVYVGMAEMLQRVLRVRPTYAVSSSAPSPRTNLFKILNEGDLPVKFHVASNASGIFTRFVLSEHDAIFDDILENLPRDPDWSGGIALRVFALAQLASRWHTLLRRSIYHIFETAGRVPQSAIYARACLSDVSKVLGLQSSQELFKLFVSQIIYTWMETESLDSIPYIIFGYHDLKDLLMDVQDEVVGQIVMRGKDEEAIELSNFLEVPFESLLESSFYKVEAYSISRDISIPPSQDSQPDGAEKSVKKRLGADTFGNLLHLHFPQIVAILIKTVDQEEQFAKSLSKFTNLQYAAKTLTEIVELNPIQTVLPASQQPSFKAKYLLEEIDYLCRRTNNELESMWTPALVAFVARALLESIHPALGSLHACSVLRKLRILICLAGSIVLHDYPLEMLLHSLRPLLADFHCSDDALGLFRYLLEKGRPHLQQIPSFMAGLAVSTLASLTVFLNSSQESTTQEAQFKATLSKAQAFHGWFGSFLEDYSSPNISGESEKAFYSILQSAQKVRIAGNASRGTHESDLIRELLDDQKSGRKLLSLPASDLVLGLLCADFQRPLDFREDIFGDDAEAATYAPTVWKSLQGRKCGEGYRLWAARVVGRAYASTGHIYDDLLREQDVTLSEGLYEHSASHVDSRAPILRALCDLLFSDSRKDVGLAERTLQSIVSRLGGFHALETYDEAFSPSLLQALDWSPYECPSLTLENPEARDFQPTVSWNPGVSASDWARRSALAMSLTAVADPVLGALPKILFALPDLGMHLFPFILHTVLLLEFDEQRTTCQTVSDTFREAFKEKSLSTVPHIRLMLNTLLYLRNQEIPRETTIADRSVWLDVDYGEAAAAATLCRMFKTALLFLETHASQAVKSSRRSSVARTVEPVESLHEVFKNIDDPDFFYGLPQEPSLMSVMEKLDYEGSGFKNLSFHSANYDGDIRSSNGINADAFGVIKALNSINLHGLAHAMLSNPSGIGRPLESVDSLLHTAFNLQQWDIPTTSAEPSPINTIFRAFQSVNIAESGAAIFETLDDCFLHLIDRMCKENQAGQSLRSPLQALAILTEVDETLSSKTYADVEEQWARMMSRDAWMQRASYQEISQILLSRNILFSSITRSPQLKTLVKTSAREAQHCEIEVLRESLRLSRDHEALQTSLTMATYLSKLVEPCAQLGLNIDAAVQYDLAKVLWDQGEMVTSIRMLQELNGHGDLQKQALPISRAEILANLGHHIAEARLEKPEEIISHYLLPAIKELKGTSEGQEAGQVFHEFASFCDQQLQNSDDLEDFKRIEKLRHRKEKEVHDLEKMIKKSEGKEKDGLKIHRTKAKQWFDLDDREYQRLKRSREAFLQQSLENYLLCLKACDTYSNDVLRFCALWLDNSESKTANSAVSKHISDVASRNFASLMNQLSSRLLDVVDDFQPLLFDLVYRICVEHPYHGMYQIFASSKSKGGKDEAALARHSAAGKLVTHLKSDRGAGSTWVAVHNSNICFVRFAVERLDEKMKSNTKVPLKKIVSGQRLEQDVTNQKIPPPTMKIPLRVDCDYSQIPKLVKFQPEFTVASGVSAPKIVTAIASDGLKYKQLFKGGNDDLRQDAIMEQVFEQVSNLLQDHRATRQRNLGIRTYKVLPLTANAGIIEFVPNTIPLHDYLMPAHQKHFPKDMKPNVCRKHISDAQTRPADQRVKVFRQVAEHFHPVMRFFFMERFNNPDEWFSKRLVYTRSTAAISILGHVLGLGDRHGHNILLDEKTGEVIHIDLGVAFEQGRVLPVPEVVPFRLTRDLVDGMGITKTEGVFRRCCEFTLEALRQDSYSIMTILDVLRYDPLYSWSVSPLRLKRMQDAEDGDGGDAAAPVAGTADGTKSRDINEPSEADRALTVVAKKLGKSLSVTATVNELIQQATDEKNLAVLYCGWAAYA